MSKNIRSYMILEGYGITLKRLTAEDLELVRVKRNSEDVKKYMHYREEITPEMQQKWFASIDNEFNNYFLIIHDGVKVGLISGAEIDWNKLETGNGGLFIWESSLWGTHVPLCAAMLLTELSFHIGFKKTYVRVLPENRRAISFNAELGYIKSPEQPKGELEVYELHEETFYEATDKIRSIMKTQFPKMLKCTIDDPEHPSSKNIIRAYSKLDRESQNQFIFVVQQ